MNSNTKFIVAAAVTGLFAGAAGRAAAASSATPVPAPHSVTARGQAPSLDSRLGQRASQLADDAKGKHDCKGKNDCKGEGGCKSSDNGCQGKNSCKGKGGCNTNGTDKKLA
jgi:hypothetical protein